MNIFTLPARLFTFALLFLSMSLFSHGQLAKDRANIFDTGGKPAVPSGTDSIAVPLSNPIGYTVLHISTDKGETPVAVWYPTTSKPESFEYLFITNRVGTEVAVNGKVAPGNFPLLVYSHGATGSGLSSVFVEESLARAGFIVAAPDHTDSFTAARLVPEDNPKIFGPFKKLAALKYANDVRSDLLGENAIADRPKVAYRPAQVTATINAVLASSLFASHVDSTKIGLFGHSFGAWTTMMTSGPVPKYADSRIKAAVVLSAPVNHYVFTPAELANIKIPMMMMFGETEVSEGRGDDRGLFYDHLTCPKYLLEISGADHFTFSGGVKEEFPTVDEYLKEDARRAAITRYTVAFFEYYFKKDPDAAKQLNVRGYGIAGYIKSAP